MNINLRVILRSGQIINCNFTKDAGEHVIRQAVDRKPKDVVTIFNGGKLMGMILVDEIAAVLIPE